MPTPLLGVNLTNLLAAEIADGASVLDVATARQLSQRVVVHSIKTHLGIAVHAVYKPQKKSEQYDHDAATAAYLGGESLKSISDRLSVSRHKLAQMLNKGGVYLRNQSIATHLVWRKMSEDERRQQVNAAHLARTNSKATASERLKRAATEQERNNHRGFFEDEFDQILRDRGFRTLPQAALDCYNVDNLVNGNVAVELSTSTIDRYKTEYGLQRLEKLAELGVSLFYIHLKSVEAARANIEHILTDLEELCRLPPGTRKNRVVRCALYRSALVRNERGQMASVPTPPEAKYIPVNADWLP